MRVNDVSRPVEGARPVPKRETTLVRRAEIIDAARTLIIRHGSEHVTVKRIAKEVGISEADIYRHFKSKKDILFLLADYIEEALLGDITRAKANGRNVLEVLNNTLRSHISSIEQRRGISFQIIAEIISLGDKELNREMAGTVNKYVGCLTELLAEGVKSGEVRDDIDLKAAATVLFGMIQGLVSTWALNDYSFDPQERFEPLWHIFREGVIKR